MTINRLFKVLYRNWLIIFLFPLLLAGVVYYLTQHEQKEYETSALVYTSLGSSKSGSVGESVRMDYYTSNNMFDNMVLLIRSRETLEEAGLRLLALHLSLNEPDTRYISRESYELLKRTIDQQLWSQLAVNGDAKKTYENLIKYYQDNQPSTIDYLLREHKHYGIFNIQGRLRANRRASSDMMEIVYKADDPGVCKTTLDLVLEIFMRSYSGLKEKENINAIKYFEEQLKIAKEKLDDAEFRIKSFISTNNILNFYEQGKYLDIALLEQERDEEIARRLKAGTESNINSIEELFDMYATRSQIIDELIGLQRLLISKNNELESLGTNPSVNSERIKWLRNDIYEIQKQINLRTDNIFEISNTREGIPKTTLLNEWLKLKVEYEQQLSSLEVMQDRRKYLASRISAFAPLGAELRKLEREVSVNEGQYLSILHGLNMAYLRKYDLEMSSNQQIIDEPYFPVNPLPSKRKIIVLGAFAAGIFLILSILIASEFLNDKIKTIQRAQQLTGLQVVGIYPNLERKKRTHVDVDVLTKSLEEQLIGQTRLLLSKNRMEGSESPNVIMLVSIRKNEGKHFFADILARLLSETDGKTLVLVHKEDTQMVSDDYKDINKFNAEKKLLKMSSLEEMVNGDIDLSNYRNIIISYPALLVQSLPENFLQFTTLTMLVLSANRKWSALDTKMKDYVVDLAGISPVILLNKMEIDDIEEGFGDVPLKKTWYRKKVDNLSAI